MLTIPSTLIACLTAALATPLYSVPVDARSETPPAIELRETPWSAGDVIHSVVKSHSTLHTIIVSNDQVVQEFDQVEDKSAEKTIEILASDERGPTRLRVEYGALRFLEVGAAERERTGDERPADTAEARNPLAHQTFFLVRKGESYRVLDARESRVDEGLAQLVLEEEGLHGNQHRRAGDMIAHELSGRPLVLGSEVQCSREAARAFVDGHDHLDDVRLTLVPRETRVVAGIPSVLCTAHLSISDTGGGDQPVTAIDLRGEMRFDLASGRFLAVELAGNLSLSQAVADQTHGIEVSGDGPWTISEVVSYGRAP